MVRKAGLDVDPRFCCEMKTMFRSPVHPSRMFGMEISVELRENGCKMTIKLK